MKEKTSDMPQFIALVMLVWLSLGLVACGQRGDQPAVDRLAATPLPTLNFEQPTTMIRAASPEVTEESDATASTADADLARGEGVYTNKGCGSCHGPKGEGVEGKAEALAGASLTEDEFTDILRTGGKGTLGNDHLYGPQAISPSGMKALYAYIKSFPAP